MDQRPLSRTARAAGIACAVVVLGARVPTAALPQQPCSHGMVRDPSPGPFVQLTNSVVSARFGVDVALDGERLAIGKWLDQHPATLFVYERDGANWFVKQQLANPSTGYGYGYGAVIDISGPLLVTSDTWEPAGGRAYVYEDQGGAWTRIATLGASDEKAGIRFGGSLATDGSRVVVGATGQDNFIGRSTGAVYVFEDPGSGWTEVQKIAPLVRQNSIQFGTQIAILDDWLFVSAPRRQEGVVYVYQHGPGGYSLAQRLTGTSGNAYARLGTGLALDGSTLLVSESTGPNGPGILRAFELVSGRWTQVDTLQGSNGSIGPVVSAGGGWAAASNPQREGGVGAVYLFRKEPAGWKEVAILEPTHPDTEGRFGTALAVEAPFVLVTSPTDSTAGSVEAFTVDGSACRSLTAFPRLMSVARDGLNVVTLDAGAGLAGARYVVLSTLHGTSPGISLEGFRLPLNPGAWFSISALPTPFWRNEVGVLDERGQAAAWLDVPALRDPGMVGLEMNHAFAAFVEGTLVHVSNTGALRFVP